MIKRIALILCFVVLMLSGCTGYRESTGTYIISAIGFDTSKDGLSVNVQAVEVGGASPEGIVFSGVGTTPEKAVYSVATKTTKTLLFDHCGIVAVGEDISGKKLSEILRFCREQSSLNLSVYVVSCENAQKLLETKAVSSVASGYDLMEILENYEDKTGVDLKNRFYELETLTRRQDNVFTLPVFGFTDNGFELDGRRVYRDYNYLLSLDNDESIVYSILCNTNDAGHVLIDKGGADLSALHTSFSYKNDVISVKTKLTGSNKKGDISESLEGGVYALVERAQKEKAGDIFGFSQRIYHRDRKLWNGIKGNYNDMFCRGEIKVKYTAKWVSA